MLTCTRCLDGRHRCLDAGCACTTCSAVVAEPAPAPRTRSARASRPPRPTVGNVPRPGRPRVWVDDRERKREHARRKRGTMPRVRAELLADPTGRTWTIGTRRVWLREVERLERAMA